MNQVERDCRNLAKPGEADAATWRFRVEEWFIGRRSVGGTVDQCHYDLQVIWGFTLEKNTIAPRVTELKADYPNEPRLYATTETRKTRSGKSATVYIHRMFFKPEAKSQQQTLFGGHAA